MEGWRGCTKVTLQLCTKKKIDVEDSETGGRKKFVKIKIERFWNKFELFLRARKIQKLRIAEKKKTERKCYRLLFARLTSFSLIYSVNSERKINDKIYLKVCECATSRQSIMTAENGSENMCQQLHCLLMRYFVSSFCSVLHPLPLQHAPRFYRFRFQLNWRISSAMPFPLIFSLHTRFIAGILDEDECQFGLFKMFIQIKAH